MSDENLTVTAPDEGGASAEAATNASAETSTAQTAGAETSTAETAGAETSTAETAGAETSTAETAGAETSTAETVGPETSTAESQADVELDGAAAVAADAGETQTGVDDTGTPAEPAEVAGEAEVAGDAEEVEVAPSAEVQAAAAALAQAFGDETGEPAPSAEAGDGAEAPAARPSPGRVPRARKTVQLPTKTTWQVRIDDDSQVWLTTSAGERLLGPAAGVGELALGPYVRAYDDLVLDVQLLEQRAAAGLELGNVRTKAQTVRDSLATIPAAGDIDALTIRLETVLALLGDRQRNQQAERAAVKSQIVAAKTVLAEEAESLAQSNEWKKTGDRFLSLVEDWKRLPVTDRTGDTELWKRIRASRDEFGRRRGAHFSELEATRGAVKAAKEKIVVAAEALATSREWGPTASRFGDLMTQWKASGRADRHVDDQLWARFKQAQDAFFGARAEHFSERTGQEKANLALKEGLLAEAEKLVPVTNADAAKRALRAIQDRWEKVGHVPREAMGRLEKRLEVVEKAIADAVPVNRRPTQARESQLTIRLRESVAKLEKDLAKAQTANKASDVAKLQTALTTQRDWLAQAERSA